jgi:predicted RNA polymerase sigma factor
VTIDGEGLLRRLTPQVLAAVVRHYGNVETVEDAAQEALLAAATQWPPARAARKSTGPADHRRLPQEPRS